MTYYLPREAVFTETRKIASKRLNGVTFTVMIVGMRNNSSIMVYHQKAYLDFCSPNEKLVGEWDDNRPETDQEIEARLFSLVKGKKR